MTTFARFSRPARRQILALISAFGLVALLIAPGARAGDPPPEPACDVDVESLTGSYIGNFAYLNSFQSFIPIASCSCGASVMTYSINNPELTGSSAGAEGFHTVTISLWDGPPASGGVQLAIGSTQVPEATPGGTGWYQTATVSWPTVSIVPGNTYVLKFTSIQTLSNIFRWVRSEDNPYTDGWFSTIDTVLPTNQDAVFQHIGFDCACPADLTDSGGGGPDGLVNVFDLFVLLGNWSTNGPGAELAEPTDVVDVFDLFVLLSAWGKCS